MVDTPTWLIPLAGFTAFCYVTSFFICGSELGELSNNPFTMILTLITFSACSGVAEWVSFVLFSVCTLPWLILLLTAIKPLFNNIVTGVVATVSLVVAALVSVGVFLFA